VRPCGHDGGAGENSGGAAAQAGRVVADEHGSFVTTVRVPQVLQPVDHPAFRSLVVPGDHQFVAVPFPEGQSVPCIAAFHVDRSVTTPPAPVVEAVVTTAALTG
jgi:hypothetical protein